MTTNRIPHIHTPSRFTPPPITKRKLCQDHPEWTTDSDKEDMAPTSSPSANSAQHSTSAKTTYKPMNK